MLEITNTTQAVKKKLVHPAIDEQMRRHESIGWKTYYNMMSEEKWKFQGEYKYTNDKKIVAEETN
jgi:hypothetical protein